MPFDFILLFFIFKLSFISSTLPTTGKFSISKYSDVGCKTTSSINLENPTAACWSTDYDNGIKPISYDEKDLILSINVFASSSCYGTKFEQVSLPCNNTGCTQNPMNKNEYFRCNYLSYPAKSNFTFAKYSDGNCQSQTGVLVLKGDSRCLKLSDNNSISPIYLENIQNLTYYYYDESDCKGKVKNTPIISCDNSCFQFPTGEYYRCKYLTSKNINSSYALIISLILLLV